MLLFLTIPLISSCSSNNTNLSEIIKPPVFPNEFSSIPEKTDVPELENLKSSEELIDNLSIGRNNPFLPIDVIEGNVLVIPESFKFTGQIAENDVINVFVTYNDQSGTVQVGDIGGESTSLLPNGWVVEGIDIDTRVLRLKYKENSAEIKLFETENINES
ncbi:hypothetical protein [Prochlorococcus sp. MIT 0801]|uniref:hypothetical protein n=1 Tax=Prochlorococcus sp. MIT 0801 TaxID=1501269 RepID=UPI0004F74F04|nr:hypothetical protein [Prochlorococcus sp. MIT 0801]AIQ97339.1 hypothetical protein EW15_1247 [Prochlorococcus sp. MIT 0801]